LRPDATPEVSATDLRMAVAAGTLSEAQAAGLLALARDRAGRRAAMKGEDEPFEFFRGFSEVFIAVGLVILLSGILGLMSLVGVASRLFLIVPLAMAGVAWWMAHYFTLRRRMVLPSVVLLAAFGFGVGGTVLALDLMRPFPNPVTTIHTLALAGAAAMGVWYWRFRLPVAMFFLGLSLLVALYALWASPADVAAFWEEGTPIGLFDLRDGAGFGLATLGFGLAAFAVAMWFDTRDPHRLGRHSATGFWLHLLAAPALVNTMALTLLNIGGTAGIVLLAAGLTVISLLALVIDRRSFVTAGMIYIGIVIAWAIRGEGEAEEEFGHWVAILIALGGFVTALGTFWVPLRGALMRALPDFPAKSRLPPWDAAIPRGRPE
jgi:MFS family permease